jgi:hypothetical protein
LAAHAAVALLEQGADDAGDAASASSGKALSSQGSNRFLPPKRRRLASRRIETHIVRLKRTGAAQDSV